MKICGQAFCHGPMMVVEWTWIMDMAWSSLTTLA